MLVALTERALNAVPTAETVANIRVVHQKHDRFQRRFMHVRLQMTQYPLQLRESALRFATAVDRVQATIRHSGENRRIPSHSVPIIERAPWNSFWFLTRVPLARGSKRTAFSATFFLETLQLS
jgi:hypothetical protein